MKFTEAKLEEALIKADSKNRKHGFNYMEKRTRRRILKLDTGIAKKHLEEKEIKQLERTVSAYFNYIEILLNAEIALLWKPLQKV